MQQWLEFDGAMFIPTEFAAWKLALVHAIELQSDLSEYCTETERNVFIQANREAQRLENIAYEAFDEYTQKHYKRG